jgi:hypothetical protein
LDSTFNLDNLSDYAATLWGLNIGLAHPEYETEEDGKTVSNPISFDYYGRLVSGWIYMISSQYSMYDITKFLQKVYGNKILVKDYNDDQTISYMQLIFTYNPEATEPLSDEELYLLRNRIDIALAKPAGVKAIFEYNQQ